VGVLATDEGAKYGLAVTTLTPKTSAVLNEIFPGLGVMPVDIGPMAPVVKDYLTLYPEVIESVMADDNVDALFNVLWADSTGMSIDAYVKAYEEVKDRYQKPLVSWVYGPDKRLVSETSKRLEDLRFPVFSDPETCIKAMGLAFQYAQVKRRKYGA
jgi:acyl-CoA synthetase (NDP forming)